jgi:hypothetical protein
VPRWLFALLTTVILFGSSVTSWAAAGFVGESECCCPVKAECRCHDHDGKPAPAPLIEKCGGTAQLIAPAVVPAISPEPFALTVATQELLLVPPRLSPLPDRLPPPPEPPPF